MWVVPWKASLPGTEERSLTAFGMRTKSNYDRKYKTDSSSDLLAPIAERAGRFEYLLLAGHR